MMVEKRAYVTHTAHGSHPAGSRCVAWLEDRTLILEFEDGERIERSRFAYYLADDLDPRSGAGA
jgi:hypothetical protein